MGKWIERPSPKALRLGKKDSWYNQMNHTYVYYEDECPKYAVMTREIKTRWGKVIHAGMRNTEGTDIPWAEKQFIKNSLFGKEKVAIEVFPKESRLVDAAMFYHLWIFEDTNFELPFGIHDLDENS